MVTVAGAEPGTAELLAIAQQVADQAHRGEQVEAFVAAQVEPIRTRYPGRRATLRELGV